MTQLVPGATDTANSQRPATLQRVAAADQIAEILKDRILIGDLRPGHSLRELELASEFGVARNTLREALRLLTRDGLTTHAVHRGVTIREHSVDEVQDLYRVRKLIQLEAGTRAGTLSDDEIQRLEREIGAGRDALKSGDSRQWMTHNLNFHQGTVNLVGSPRLEEIFRSIMRELRLVLVWLERDPASAWDVANENLLTVLRSGTESDYHVAVTEYLRASCEEVVAAIRRRSAADAGSE